MLIEHAHWYMLVYENNLRGCQQREALPGNCNPITVKTENHSGMELSKGSASVRLFGSGKNDQRDVAQAGMCA